MNRRYAFCGMLFAGLLVGTNSSFAGKPAKPDPVTIVNTPLPVEVVALVPFQADICKADGAGISCGTIPNTITVPGKRLVVELLTGFCETGTATTLQYALLSTTIGSAPVFHVVTLTPVSPPVSIGNRYTFTQPSRIYADPGTNVTLQISGFGADDRRCAGTISGQLVN
jgi:hypothetical protein